MPANTLLVFIDGLPYGWYNRFGFERASPVVQPLRPSFGYSLNIKAQLFAGISADEWGLLNEYSPAWTQNDVPTGSVLRLPHAIDRVVHKALSYVTGRAVGNIPIGMLSSFTRRGTNAYECGFASPTLLNTHSFTARLLYSALGHNGVLTALKNSNGRENTFVAIGQLDQLLHSYGPDHRIPQDYAVRCSDLIAEVSPRYDRTILISDHGHGPVTNHVDTSRYWNALGRAGRFFVDATMIRFWNSRSGLNPSWLDLLSEIDCRFPGQFLTLGERAAENITSSFFGDAIFVLPDGLVFSPNFYGREKSVSMHGYWPISESQHGVIASSSLADARHEGVCSAREAHRRLGRWLAQATGE